MFHWAWRRAGPACDVVKAKRVSGLVRTVSFVWLILFIFIFFGSYEILYSFFGYGYFNL